VPMRSHKIKMARTVYDFHVSRVLEVLQQEKNYD